MRFAGSTAGCQEGTLHLRRHPTPLPDEEIYRLKEEPMGLSGYESPQHHRELCILVDTSPVWLGERTGFILASSLHGPGPAVCTPIRESNGRACRGPSCL